MRSLLHIASTLVLGFLLGPSLEAADLDDLEATANDGLVSVAVTLTGVFDDPETIQRVESGLPLVIVYEFDLIRKRKNWFDSIIASAEIELVATYNSLTREYLLNLRRNRKLVSSESIRSIEELGRRMSEIQAEGLFELGSHQPRKLRLRARAVFGRRYLMHVIPRPVATEWDVVRVDSGKSR